MLSQQAAHRPQRSHCKHINKVGDYTPEDISRKRGIGRCEAEECYSTVGNLWACLHHNCLFVGCAGNEFNHILRHYEESPDHCIILDLHSLRVFCYKCENEIFLENNDPPIPGTVPPQPTKPIRARNVCKAEPNTDSEDDDDLNTRPKGLTGLKNLSNTCYINAALQALSNCPPLTQYFLDCGHSIRNSNRDNIAKSYSKLMHDIWHKKRPSFIIPDTLVYNFKESSSAHWIFGNYNQQDSQEFLRYFMDALHEELKEPVCEVLSKNYINTVAETYDSCLSDDDNNSSISEMDYESCDSGSLSLHEENVPSDTERSPNQTLCNPEKVLSATNQKTFYSSKNSHLPEVESKEHKDIVNRQQALVTRKSAEVEEQDNKSPSSHESSKNKDAKLGSMACSDVLTNVPHFNTNSMTTAIPIIKRKPTELHSIISDIFDGKIVSSVQCLTCDTVSSTKETFQDLSLPIPSREQLVALHSQSSNSSQVNTLAGSSNSNQYQGWLSWGWSWLRSWLWGPAVTLHDCLAAFFSADELKGDNMYSCGKCKKLRNGIKYSRVLNLPEVLCIHLKRFRNDLTKTAKISNLVSFPLENLDLSPYMHKDGRDQITTYDLNAVICHYGSDSGCGHYTSYAMNTINGGWYEFDDQYVTEVMPEVVLNCEAYVLFYRKTSEEMNRRRGRVIELMKRSHREPGLLQFYISKQWVNKFNTFAEPGPITNTDFLCQHGGVHPIKASSVEDMCTVMSQSVWEYLYETFGGGPACNHLYVCPTCQAERNYLEKRQKSELEKFIKLHREFQAVDQPAIIFAISMSWFREWENFVKAKDVIIQPPGPIDNSKVVCQKGNQQILKLGSDYGQMSETMWHFLHDIYGGGPQIIIRPSTSPTSIIVTQTQRTAHSPTLDNKLAESDEYSNVADDSHSTEDV